MSTKARSHWEVRTADRHCGLYRDKALARKVARLLSSFTGVRHFIGHAHTNVRQVDPKDSPWARAHAGGKGFPSHTGEYTLTL